MYVLTLHIEIAHNLSFLPVPNRQHSRVLPPLKAGGKEEEGDSKQGVEDEDIYYLGSTRTGEIITTPSLVR